MSDINEKLPRKEEQDIEKDIISLESAKRRQRKISQHSGTSSEVDEEEKLKI
jgi:hypothetical protein